MNFDIVSDLHIDHWGRKHEFDWLHSQKSDTLIVAGDTSDSVAKTKKQIEEEIVEIGERYRDWETDRKSVV